MNSIDQLVECATATSEDIKAFVTICQTQCSNGGAKELKLPTILHDAPANVQQMKRSMLANVAKLQQLIMGPSELLQQLACQVCSRLHSIRLLFAPPSISSYRPAVNFRIGTKTSAIKSQLLACLHWLGDFQVLACIPLRHSVPIKDISDLAGVPETQLSRIVRMTMTFGFLCEPEPGRISHSTLSAPFVTNPALLDAVVFLAGTAVPSALKMPVGTKRLNESKNPQETAYNIASNSTSSFNSACEQRPQLKRQWSAFRRYSTGDVDDSLVEILQSSQCANRLREDPGTIVEIGPRSTAQAIALANHYPCLQIIVQIDDLEARPQSSWGKHAALDVMPDQMGYLMDGRIAVQQRTVGTAQTVRDAVVYILHLSPSASGPAGPAKERIQAELRQLVDVLRNNSSATLILTSGLLPELGTVCPKAEARARSRDLTLFQLTNQTEIEMAEMMVILNGMGDNMGRLVLANKHCSSTRGTVALETRYQAYANG